MNLSFMMGKLVTLAQSPVWPPGGIGWIIGDNCRVRLAK